MKLKSKTASRGQSLSLGRSMAFAIAATIGGSSFAAASGPQQTTEAKDLGSVNPSSRISATVWLRSAADKALADAIDALNDPSSNKYHDWMSDAELARYGATAQDTATVAASLKAMGLSVDRVSDDGRSIRVSGSARAVQGAFGTALHAWQKGGRIFTKAASTPSYQGAHPELIGAVAGLSGEGIRPFVSRQVDLATGRPVAPFVPQAGTDPLAGFTSNCFGATQTESSSGYAGTINGVATFTKSKFTGPTYMPAGLDPTPRTCGLTAREVRSHYGLDEAHALGWTGQGETIVIVDAYGSPTALSDLNAFSSVMGLPAMNGKTFRVVTSDGAPDGVDADWALETTLDIEWAHAIAPDAKIVLVVAPSADNAELAYAVRYAADQRFGNVISASWGLPEAEADIGTARMFNEAIQHAAARGIAFNVASGDSGDNGVGTPLGAPNIPSDSPYATAVGGTSIGIPSDNGAVETGWGLAVTSLGATYQPYSVPDARGTLQGSGGGESVFFAKPRFERSLHGAGRQVPDVAALADPQTGAIAVFTEPASGTTELLTVGGTSLATPIFSAIWALADQAAGESLGQAAPLIAKLPPYALRDILPIQGGAKRTTSGSIDYRNVLTTYTAAQLLGIDQTQPKGFTSTLFLSTAQERPTWYVLGFGIDTSLQVAEGWDNVTGYGVPSGLTFIDSLRQFARRR